MVSEGLDSLNGILDSLIVSGSVGGVVGGVVIGGGLSYWLDKQFGSSPALTFVLGIVGFAAGIREVLRRIPKDDEEPGGNGGNRGAGDGE